MQLEAARNYETPSPRVIAVFTASQYQSPVEAGTIDLAGISVESKASIPTAIE